MYVNATVYAQIQLYVYVCGHKSNIPKSVISVNAIKLWTEQEPACLSTAAKRGPKPTATGETWQSCRLEKGRVLSRLMMIMVVAGVQTDTAELVCTVRGHRSLHAHWEDRSKEEETVTVDKDWAYCTSPYPLLSRLLCDSHTGTLICFILKPLDFIA